MFSRVDLRPHENTLRNMLIAEEPGDPTKYGCLMFGIIAERDVVSDLIDQPECLRLEGIRCYRFVFSGLCGFSLLHLIRQIETQIGLCLVKKGLLLFV